LVRKFPLPFRGEGKGEGYAKIESQNAFSVEGKTLIWTCMIRQPNLCPRKADIGYFANSREEGGDGASATFLTSI
ncbi:MAG: hypothetical protein Q8O01_01315, partial [Candidatus Omnitrophota bacterium]|nr:hypothetical protein [Candidatus Omnitrophota bacterium]